MKVPTEKEPSELAKALDIILKSSAIDQADGSHRNGYATPPIVAYGDEAGSEGEVHLRDYWRTVRKRLWLVIGLAVIVSTIAAIWLARQPDIFQARARVQVDNENHSPALGASRGNMLLLDYGNMDPDYFNTQVQILSSPTLLGRVTKTLDLEHNRNFHPAVEKRSPWQSLLRMVGLGQKSKQTTGQIEPSGVAQVKDYLPSTNVANSKSDAGEIERLAPYVETLQDTQEVAQVKRTRLIDIRYTHVDPLMATKIVNAVADAFALWNLEVRTATNTIAGTYLDKRIAELQSQIRNGEEQLANYAQSHEILSLDASQNTVVERLAGLNRQLLEAENERHLAEASYRSNLAPGAAEASVEISEKQIAEFKSRLVELKQKRAQLLLTDTEESPEVKDVNEQIALLQKQLEDTRDSAKSVLTANLETNYRRALDREKALRQSFNEQRSETVTQNQAAINYNILKQEIETNKGLLEGLMQRAKENDVTMAGTPNNIHVVDYGAVPKTPVGPKRLRGVFVALFLAVAFGIGLALFLEYLDDTVKSPGDVERELRLPVLAVIPINGRTATQRLLPGTLHGHSNGSGRELLINTDGPSMQAEAYRHLRTSVLLSTPGRAPKTLLVTSSVPAEGKTTTVVNTAVVLAQTGGKVLVIDADMRRPRLHQLFAMENNQGLSSLLSSDVSEIEILAMISQFKDTNVYLLSSGAIPPNPAELLGSEQMKRLLELVGRTFDYVVVDSPPIASFTDGVLISLLVDGVLLVVHGGKTSQQVVKRTRQILHEIGAKIIGVVLNKIDVRSHSYYYYQDDYESYYHSSASNGDHEPANSSLSVVSK